MAKQFSRVGKEIAIAVKAGGGDVENNPVLRRAVQNARAVNMPKDKVESAIKRALGKDRTDYEEIMYEGYAPHGIALIVETATDNPTRTVANVRSYFNKFDGSLSTSGSVSFQFKKMGVFNLAPEGLDAESLELDLIDYGLEELGEGTGENGEEVFVVRCGFTDFGNMQSALEEKGIKTLSSEMIWLPQNIIELPEEQSNDVLKLVARLEEDDDVQKVFHNLA
jgi:YebC/PmpR family DNA-binding regulatory protein